MKSLNFLKACAVNSFLKALNNPEEIEGFISDASILSEQGKADFANFLYQDSLKEEREDIKNAIKECASIWTPAFILAVINTNRSSVPYTLQDVENATTAGADILTFGKACSMDDKMNPSLSKALNTGSIEGFRIFPEQSLEKANKKGTPQYEKWLVAYRAKRGAKAKPEDAEKEKSAAKEVLESKETTESRSVNSIAKRFNLEVSDFEASNDDTGESGYVSFYTKNKLSDKEIDSLVDELNSVGGLESISTVPDDESEDSKGRKKWEIDFSIINEIQAN